MLDTVVVIPCYREQARLDPTRLLSLLDRPGLRLVLVDDGSPDDTASMLHEVARLAPAGRVRVLVLARNVGKGEAVRAGINEALTTAPDVVGYLDADLATSPEAFLELLEELDRPEVLGVLGSRVRLLGRDIQRRASRHYLGRILATAASLLLDLPVYDTQCGAKAFRSGAALSLAASRPFTSRWLFDVELLARLLYRPGPDRWRATDLVEYPLTSWRDVGKSKLGALHMAGAGFDFLRIAVEVVALRRACAGSR